MAVQKTSVDLEGKSLRLQFPYNPSTINSIRLIAGAKWEPMSKSWMIPFSSAVIDLLKKIFPDLEFGSNLKSHSICTTENLIEATERKFLPKATKVKITDFVFSTEPYVHQKISFNFARALPQTGLFLEMGLGKAKITIDLNTWRFRQKQIKRVLVVCPNSVLPQWGVEIERHGSPDFKKYEILEGGSRQKLAECQRLITEGFQGFIIVNYDALLHMYTQLMEMQRGSERLFDSMCLDESSFIKHATSKRSKICWKLGQTVQFRNILTGTPITQSLEDIFSQYRFLKSEIFGIYSTAFRGNYLILGGFEMRQIIGYRNIEDVLRKIYSISIRFTKDRCLDIPPKVYETRYARMDVDISRKYKTLEKECVVEFAGKQIAAPLVMTKIMKLSQITGGFIYEQGDDGQRIATHRIHRPAKLSVLEEILDEAPGRKMIIWCRFTEEMKLIRDLLCARGVKYVSMAGDVKISGSKQKKGEQCACGDCRGCFVRQFQDDPSTTIFLGQIATAGMGITLTAADLVVYYSNDYSLEHRLQSEDRCHRIGQTKSVTYIDILAETSNGGKTIDHDTLTVIQGKNRFANEISRALMQQMSVRQKADPFENKLAKFVKAEKAAGTYKGVIKNPAHVRGAGNNSDPILTEEEIF